MKYYNIKITFTISEKDYKRYNKNIDSAMDMILPCGADYEVKEIDCENKKQ